MKVLFLRAWKNHKGRIFHKGAEEGLTNDIARKLIKSRHCKQVIEQPGLEESLIVDKKGKPILKVKENANDGII